jgi:type VI secretion system secreted protein Hcp
MPVPAYMKIEGVTQGNITEGANSEESVGNIYQEEHADEILVQAFKHDISIPRDPQSGQPTGTRVHHPMVITKIFDKSSPLLYQSLVTGERLTVTIEWYRTSPEGTDEQYFTMALEDAVIVDMNAYMPNCQDPANAHFTHLEDVSFTYRKITWTHNVAGTEGSDDWRTRGSKS